MPTNNDSILFPPQASTFAQDVDALYYFIHYLSVFFWVGIVAAIVYFVWRYKRGHREGVGPSHNLPMELTWSIIPLILVIAVFLWGFKGFMGMSRAPSGAEQIQVTGKKWLWNFEYPNGQQAIGELHVEVNKPYKLIMTSEDVIHSFFVPSFRNKMDVVPGRITTFWFEPTMVGEQQVFCTEYCGDGHSDMLAKIVVHTPEDYAKWVEENQKEDTTTPLPELGEKLYTSKACFTCHSTDGSVKVGPTFQGLFGKQEQLTTGQTVPVDEEYLRESILQPNAKVVQGYQPVMPTYQGQLSDREVSGLIEYIKTL
ncbi:cytochrome c oxidase subunit II [Vulgatibacter sp.]|uniref:cytochrome c oxidase subunit II n=1 Tax=Vulgatibacter sp. TaxID=1971226 RepID=UPI00356AD12E